MSTSGAVGALDAQHAHRQIDVNATKNVDVHRDPGGPLEFAATVLRALPLYDTLAILILLMQVPPVALSVIYMAFTFLTFVPPVTTSSGMNINLAEIFDHTSTMPSLVTTLCMDVLIMLVWLFLMPPVQAAILDLAKPVIAVTLGGGSSSREGNSRGVTTCFLLVIASHVLRGTRLHWTRVTRLLPPDWRFGYSVDETIEAMQGFDKRGPHGWIKSILAIHILTQGIVRYIREWYLRREKGNASSGGVSDPEAGKATSESAGEGSMTADGDANAQQNAATTTSKKRRKQSTQVRLQQPLWAALASTKIVMVKEYELSHAASESAGNSGTDIHNLGSAPFDSQAEQVWISYIGYDEVCFNTSHFDDVDMHANGHPSRPVGADPSKPFYVRVNNAFWQPTRIFCVENQAGDESSSHRWCGDIYGLRPMSKYVCEFVDTRTGQVIFSTSIRTTQAPAKDQEGVASPPVNGQSSLRPDSPVTTLRSTISAQNDKLSDEKSRLKGLRKDWKSRISALKKENDKLDNAIQSGGSNDDKLKQKVIQQETHRDQASREISELQDTLKAFETAPEGLHERKKQAEKAWSAEKSVFDTESKAFKEFKAKLASDIKTTEDEQTSLQTKRNKMAARITKVDTDLGRITDANTRGLDEAERRRQARAALETETTTIENNFRESIANLQATNAAKQGQVNTLMSQLQSFHEQINYSNTGATAFDASQPAPASSQTQFNPNATSWNPNPAAAPHFPGTSTWGQHASSNTPSLLPAPVLAAPSAASIWGTGPAVKSRGRSSSMLSDVSGFTQSSAGDDEYVSMHNTPAAAAAARSGSGSGSTSENGDSVRDPMSPT
jgi:predicted  nucleic acid-binding Zn-ribbon protein